MTAPTQTDARARYEQTAAAAAALYAASKASPNPIETIKHTVTSAASLTAAVSKSTTAAILGLWRRTDTYDERAVDKFVAGAGKLMVSAQRSTATVNTAAQLAQLKAVGINTKVSVTIPDQVRGATAEFGDKVTVTAPAKTRVDYKPTTPTPPAPAEAAGTPRVSVPEVEKPVARTVTHADSAPDLLFSRAVVTYRYERSTGADHATANAAAEQRIEGLVDTNVMLAQRLAEQQTLTKVADLDQKVIGYRRVFHPELSKGGTCGLCIAASDRIYTLAELKPIHARCKCTIAPVTEDHDPGHRINEDDLKMLYKHAGTTSGRTQGHNLKRTRYVIEQHQELGPVLTRVTGEKVPYSDDLEADRVARTAGKAATPRTPAPPAAQTSREFAAHQLVVLRASLERLRSEGFAEDSSPVQYHLRMIAKFEAITE
ncbi:hypothetical protein ACWCW7_35195 [Nocardia tengchongensis]